MLNEMLIFAEAAAPAGQGDMKQFIGMMVIMVALFYFAIIRPQRRQQKERKEMMGALKAGDRVLLGGGILGEIKSVKEHSVMVQIAEGTKVEALRSSITKVLEDDANLSGVEQA